MTTATATPQEIVKSIVSELNDCPADVNSADWFETCTKGLPNQELTKTLCSADTYDTIVTIQNEHWLIIDENNSYSCDFIGAGNLLYGWTEEMIGQDELTDDQKEAFQSNLPKNDLYPPGFSHGDISRRLTEGKKQLNILLVLNISFNHFKGNTANRGNKIGICP